MISMRNTGYPVQTLKDAAVTRIEGKLRRSRGSLRCSRSVSSTSLAAGFDGDYVCVNGYRLCDGPRAAVGDDALNRAAQQATSTGCQSVTKGSRATGP
jgi:hypothetical protein